VGEACLVKVHVHTDDPPQVIATASTFGRLDRLNVGDMSTQHKRILEEERSGANGGADLAKEPGERPAAARPNGIGLVAVVTGTGLVDIFRGLGVDAVVEGGQTMNPSTKDLVQAIESAPYPVVILLPNNKNILLAAREVGPLTEKTVHLVETHTVPQGIAALIAFNGERPAEDNVKAMRAAGERIQTIEVTRAVRDTRSNGLRVKKGDVIALVNDKLENAGGDYADVVGQALDRLGPDSYELVTVYTGEGASKTDTDAVSAAIRTRFPGLELEVQAGGQDHYPFIVSVE